MRKDVVVWLGVFLLFSTGVVAGLMMDGQKINWVALASLGNNSGLAAWVQAGGVIASIWGAFAISNSQRKSQIIVAAKAAKDKSEAMTAVVSTAVEFISILGNSMQGRPGPLFFKTTWALVNKQWLESTILSVSQLPAHELGCRDMVFAFFGIKGAINEIGRLIDRSLNAEAFREQEYDYMCDEVLRQVRAVESNWRSFEHAASRK